MKIFILLVSFILVSFVPGITIETAHAGAAVAKQRKGAVGVQNRAMPQQLPPGYVMTPEGVKKIEAPPSLKEPVDPAEVKDIVDLSQLTDSLKTSSEAWDMIISPDDKALVVNEFIKEYAAQGVTIKKPGEFYANVIDQMAAGSQEMLAMPFERVLQVVAVMEYDFDNGQNPDALAQKILGPQFYAKNKERLMNQSQAQQQEWSRMHNQ